MNTKQELWSDERTARLHELLDQRISFTLIALELGVSRNAVAGKVYRLGLSQPKPLVRIHKQHPERYTVGTLPPRKTPTRFKPSNPPVSLLNIGPGFRQCRYPVSHDVRGDGFIMLAGTGPDMLFCAAPTVEGQSWCPHHSRIITGHKMAPTTKQAMLRKHRRTQQANARAA